MDLHGHFVFPLRYAESGCELSSHYGHCGGCLQRCQPRGQRSVPLRRRDGDIDSFAEFHTGHAYSRPFRSGAALPCRRHTRSGWPLWRPCHRRGGGIRSFTVPDSQCGIPATATAYSLNVAVVPAGALGFLTVWPSGQTQPVVSTLNSLDGRIKIQRSPCARRSKSPSAFSPATRRMSSWTLTATSSRRRTPLPWRFFP